MSDIAKCSGKDCTLKETCYRFTSTSSDYLQSYFARPPTKGEDENGVTKCDYYWESTRSYPTD